MHNAMKICREHGVRVTEAMKPSRDVRVGGPRAEFVAIGYVCPVSPTRVLREDEVIDPDD